MGEEIGAPPARNAALAGWGRAAPWAVGTAVAGWAVGVLAVLLARAGAGGRAPFGETLRSGGLLFLWFQRVPVAFDPAGTPTSLRSLGAFSPSVTVGLLLGTAGVVALLALGGRSVAEHAGGPWWMRTLHGAKVAVPYAITVAVVAGLTETPIALGRPARLLGFPAAGAVARPAAGWALVSALAIAALAGLSGGAASASEGRWPLRRWERRARAAVAGGWRMLALGLVFAFVGLLALAAAEPRLARLYVDGMFSGGATRGLALLAFNLLVLPDMAVWLLSPAMGSCVTFSATFVPVAAHAATTASTTCVISFRYLPVHPLADLGFGPGGSHGGAPLLATPSAGYLLLMLVPATAVVVGGWLAAGRARAEGRAEGAVVGAMSGVVFALLALVAAALSAVAVHIAAPGTLPASALALRLGPDVLTTGVLALLWGLAGGAIGGAVRRPPAVFAWLPAAGEAPVTAGQVAPATEEAPPATEEAPPPTEEAGAPATEEAGAPAVSGPGEAPPPGGDAEDQEHQQEADPHPTEDDAGDGEPAPALDAGGGVDVTFREVAEDEGQGRADPPEPEDAEHE